MKTVARLLVGFLLLSLGSSLQAKEATVSFNNQIQPILSEYCYPCHGPDSSTRKPKKQPLRLDREDFAFKPRDNGQPVIIRGDAKNSELVRRIRATDDDVMPPASEHKQIKSEEIALLEQWVAQGAKYEKHWSLIPPSRPKVPSSGGGWAKNPIDRFVAQKLEQSGLKPNGEEKPSRLIRRLSYDLTGLPPTPDEVQRFVKNPKSYEQSVEQFLASDASAEHFTRHWLDAVRYADTQGIHHDHARSIWAYRDWVIAAFKQNMRFDQFTIEQLAGDLLPETSMEQKIASGFNRLLPTTGEGGAIPDEYAAIYAKDRVETTTAIWLGLTTGCATCHDHKFDPVTMKDFYSLTAFFRNNTMPALDSGRDANTAPLLFVPATEDRSRWAVLQSELKQRQEAIEARRREARPDFEQWISQRTDNNGLAAPDLHLALNEATGNFKGTSEGRSIEAAGEAERRPGPLGPAPRVQAGIPVENAAPTVPHNGQASYGALLLIEGAPSGAVFSRMDRSKGYRGWDLFLTSGKPTVHIIDSWPESSLKVTAKEKLNANQWYHVMAVFDGSRKGADAIALYINGRKAEVEVNNNSLGSNIVSEVPLRLGGRSDGEKSADGPQDGKVYLQDLRFYEQALEGTLVARIAAGALLADYRATAPERRTEAQTNTVYDLFLGGFDSKTQELQRDLAKLKAEEQAIRGRGATTLVMEEKQDSEPVAYILTRGNYASKGDAVKAATPEALPAMDAALPRNRLGLARWLFAKENPLTARVTVNRLWAQVFGIGIVETTEDFGIKGTRPTNQDLLDWLAVEFVESGWDVRHVVTLMVTSATYRQSEAISAAKLEKDPQNKLCSRGPHIRLDAEQIRDGALAASGLLVRKVGGPSVKPYQPEGVWEAVAMKDSNTRVYRQDSGDALYRRSLYTFWKRTAPPPTMEILNAPSREVFCTRRDRTDTPLQAFVTMNDPQFIEAARQLAALAIGQSEKFDERLNVVTDRLLARRLSADERAIIRKLEERALKDYRANTEAARALIEVGESKPDVKLDASVLAAWTLVASQVMNLDEALTK